MNQKDFWERKAPRRVPDHPVVRAFSEPKVDFIRSRVNGVERILDVGCGNGYFTRPLSKWARCTALDFSEYMLELNFYGRRIRADARDIPFSDNTFDLAVCSNLLHHVPDPLKVVKEMARVSRYVALSEPNRNNPLMFLFGLAKSVERGTLRFSKGYLRRLVEQAGLKVMASKTMGMVLPNKTPKWLLWLPEIPTFFNVMVCEK